MKNLIISDFDGTLKTTEEHLKQNIAEIKKYQNKDNYFRIATGSSYESIIKYINEYNIEYDFLILGHGSVILDNQQNEIISFKIDRETTKQILDEIEEKFNINGIKIYDFHKQNHNIKKNKTTKLRIINNNIKEISEIKQYIDLNYNYNTYLIDDKVNKFVDIINSNKSKAIKALTEKIYLNNVYTIGNDVNDIEMILDFNGYRMRDCEEVLKLKTNQIYNQVYELIQDVAKKK